MPEGARVNARRIRRWIEACGAVVRLLFRQSIGTSIRQSRALAGWPRFSSIFCLRSSSDTCADGSGRLTRNRIDVRPDPASRRLIRWCDPAVS